MTLPPETHMLGTVLLAVLLCGLFTALLWAHLPAVGAIAGGWFVGVLCALAIAWPGGDE